MEQCPFCSIENEKIFLETDSCMAFFDNFPVTRGHILVIPKKHVSNYFEATKELKKSIWAVVDQVKDMLDKQYKPDGFNIGINVNEVAGQTIFHCHIHVIPRYSGDMENPKGGVRGVIPSKQKY